MRKLFVLVCLVLTGCGSIVGPNPSPNASVTNADFVYLLPKGMVVATVFGDQHGVAVTFDPAETHKDNGVGPLYVDFQHSVFNKETVEIKTGDTPGLLSLVSSETEVKILDIATEVAKSAAKISLQNGKQDFFSSKVIIGAPFLFDPLDKSDRDIAAKTICEFANYGYDSRDKTDEANAPQKSIFLKACSDPLNPELKIKLRGASQSSAELSQVDKQVRKLCSRGICARQMITHVIELTVGDIRLLSHAVDIPSKQVISIPVDSSIFADRKTTITISDGILKEYKLEKESELLTIVKLPGAIISGFLAGLGEHLDAEKSVLDKQKSVIDSKKSLYETEKSFKELTNESGQKIVSTSYIERSTTVYFHHNDLNKSIQEVATSLPNPSDGGPLVGQEEESDDSGETVSPGSNGSIGEN